MNTVPPTTAPVNPLTVPYALGVQDAHDADACRPELYFAESNDKVAYCQGYESVAGRTPITAYYLNPEIDFDEPDEPMSVDSYEVESVCTVITSSNVPTKQLYWQGYDQYLDCAATGDWLDAGELAAMTPDERRGYETAARHAADTETYDYLYNTNAYGDRTEW